MRSPIRLLPALVAGAVALAGMAAAPDELEINDRGLVVVGVDDAGDWGASAGAAEASPFGEAAGQDLIAAAVGVDPDDPAQLLFEIQVASLPAMGGMPEGTRYTWNFKVDGESNELDGKFTNYSRGACDPTSGACPPPRDPGMAPFSLRGNCGVSDAGNVTTCEELALFHATFDAGAGTITIPVPMELVGAVECSVIKGDGNLFGGSISAAPSAFFTSSAMPLDVMIVGEKFEVPMADGSECPVIE